MSISKFPFAAVLAELHREYEVMSGDSNPAKISARLEPGADDNVWRRYMNVMGASLSDGTFGSKTVIVDEELNKLTGDVLHYSEDGFPHYRLPASLVTPIRCGLMAALAMTYRQPIENYGREVLIVGAGNLGVAVAATLRALLEHLDVRGGISVLTGSRRWLNKDRLPTGVKMIGSLNAADEVTTLITCTNHSGDPLSQADFPKFLPEEIIAFDAGYLLGPDFRRTHKSFCDHPAQIAHTLDVCFPHDGADLNDPVAFLQRTRRLGDLCSLAEDAYSASYLEGIAMADLVVGRAIYRHLEQIEVEGTLSDRLLYV